jgi:hypothetical protein
MVVPLLARHDPLWKPAMTNQANPEQIARGLEEAARVEAARRFLDDQLAKQDTILTPEEYYRALGNLVAAIPPFKRPKFHFRKLAGQ